MDKKIIEKVAECANLKLSKDEIENFTKDFTSVLDAFSKLDDVKVDKIESSFHPVKTSQALRGDIIKESLSQKEAISLSEHKKEGYFKGPKII